MRVTAREILAGDVIPMDPRRRQRPTRMNQQRLQQDFENVKFEMEQLQSAIAAGNLELAFYAARNLADEAQVLMSNVKPMIGSEY